MKTAAIVLAFFVFFSMAAQAGERQPAAYAGSKSCRECHERFYGLWSSSIHGLAMQPYTEALAKEKLTPQKDDVVIGKQRYRAEIGSAAATSWRPGRTGRRSSTGSSMPSAARTSSTSSPPWTRGGCRPCRWPMTSARRSGSTPPSPGCATSPASRRAKRRWGGRSSPTPSTPPATAATSASSPPTTI